jgi:hypothetical protein
MRSTRRFRCVAAGWLLVPVLGCDAWLLPVVGGVGVRLLGRVCGEGVRWLFSNQIGGCWLGWLRHHAAALEEGTRLFVGVAAASERVLFFANTATAAPQAGHARLLQLYQDCQALPGFCEDRAWSRVC